MNVDKIIDYVIAFVLVVSMGMFIYYIYTIIFSPLGILSKIFITFFLMFWGWNILQLHSILIQRNTVEGI